MATPEEFEATLDDLVDRFSKMDIGSDDAATAAQTLVTFSKLRPPEPTPEPIPEIVVPPTTWERFKCGLNAVWDNETTRTCVKAGGALAGVLVVTYTTIKRDHVYERAALQQANQRQS